MSGSDSRDRGRPPSNTELAERTARIEENVEHVAETVERIEERLVDEQEEIVEQVDENATRLAPMWTAFTLLKWGVPTAGTVAAALVALGFL